MATAKTRPTTPPPTASRVLARRYHDGDPGRTAGLEQTRREMALGDQIRELREARGLTQSQLAESIGTNKSAVSRIEDADYDSHSVRTLKRVAAALGCHLEVAFVEDPVAA